MKKYFLLIAVMVVVFLGLGNYGFAQTCVNDSFCGEGKTCFKINPSNLTGTCMSSSSNTPTIGTVDVGGFCTSDLNCKAGLICSQVDQKCMIDPSIATNDCSNCRKLSTPDEIAGGCTSTESQKSCSDGTYCCPKATGEPCNKDMSFSSLAGKDNAIVSIPGVSCKCAPNYGEYYNPTTKETTCELCSRDDVCCGVKLNTSVPFIGNCLESKKDNPTGGLDEAEAFPVLMSSLTQMLVTIILIVSFVLIIIGGIQIATGNPSGGKKMIIKVVVAIAILGASGVILRLINPNFFG